MTIFFARLDNGIMCLIPKMKRVVTKLGHTLKPVAVTTGADATTYPTASFAPMTHSPDDSHVQAVYSAHISSLEVLCPSASKREGECLPLYTLDNA